MVAGGIYDSEKTQRLNKAIFPKNVPFSELSVTKIDPKTNTIYTEDGDSYTYDNLIIATGLINNYDAIKGATAALEDPACPVGSAYDIVYADKMK